MYMYVYVCACVCMYVYVCEDMLVSVQCLKNGLQFI